MINVNEPQESSPPRVLPCMPEKPSTPVRKSGIPAGKIASIDAATGTPKAPSKVTSPGTSKRATDTVKRFKGRGSVVSFGNPETITNEKGEHKPNPFYEPMPAKEVWHRRMPQFFPFGETPYMEQVISRQITEDLARGKRSFTETHCTY